MKFSFSRVKAEHALRHAGAGGLRRQKQRVSYDRHAFDSAIKDAASEYGVDAKLITAMIRWSPASTLRR